MSGKIIITANGGAGKKDHVYNLCYNGSSVGTYKLTSDADVARWEVDDYEEKKQYVARKSDTGNVTVTTIEITTEKGYDLQVKYVKCWWAEIQIANSASTDIYYNDVDESKVDQEAVNNLLEGAAVDEAAENILESVTEKSKTGTKSDSYTKEKNPNIFVLKEYSQYSNSNSGQEGFLNGIYNKICNDTSKTITYAEEKDEALIMDRFDEDLAAAGSILVDTGTEKKYYYSVDKETLISNGIISESTSDYEYDAMNTVRSDIKTKECSIVQTKSLTYGIPSGSYNMDGVLALLKDSSTEKPKEYKDIYDRNNSGYSKIAPGEMLVNGAEMIFNLLDASENTEGLSDVMRYLLYLYSGEDYGVTEASFGMFSDLGFAGYSGSSFEEKVWFALKNAGITNEFAIAGAMGNFMAESGFKSNNLQNSFEGTYTDESYTAAVNNGSYKNFTNDGYGYGLAQWTDSSRKTGLYNYAKSKGVGIDDEDMQIEYMIAELTGTGPAIGYGTINWSGSGYNGWKNAKSVEEATEIFCRKFERAGVEHMDNRKNYAKGYYDSYHGKNYTGATGEKICKAAADIYKYAYGKYSYNVSYPTYKFDGGPGIRAMRTGKKVCCASFVAWVLYESGVVNVNYIDSLYFRGATELGDGLKKLPGSRIIKKGEEQAGDIFVWPNQHTQIYAGGGMWYNGGSGMDTRAYTIL